jgi:O-antigen ligase
MAQAFSSGFAAPLGRRLPQAEAVEALVVAIGSCTLITGVSAAAGGYFPTSWGWTALALFWVTGLAVLLRGAVEVGAPELIFLGSLTLFGGWVWVSTIWSQSTPRSFLEGQRMLVYLAGGAAAVLLVGRRSVPQLLGGLLTAITLVSAYGLATRLFPNRLGTFDPFAGYRLEAPVGYWNALGILAAMGALLGLGFAARGLTRMTRGLGAASLAVLFPVVYFTYSRGAWIALAIGVLAAIAAERRRLQLVTAFAFAAAAPAVSVLIASRFDALTHKITSIDAATHDGQRFALVVLGAAAAGAFLTVAVASQEARFFRLGRAARLAYGGTLLALLLGAILVATVRYGSPPTIARKAYDSFVSKPTAGPESNLNERLFSFQGSGRGQLWSVALHDFERHPLLGSGAGSFEQEWYRHRDIDLSVRDAHGIYVEQLGELGLIGIVLLLVALFVPFYAAWRARGVRLVGAAVSAYLAFLLHAAVDWDWEVPAVTLAGLLCGVALLAAARADRPARPIASSVRIGGVAVSTALAALAFVGLVGNLALASSVRAAGHRDWDKAVSQARKASDWAPWSSEALGRLGEAQLEQGKNRAAAASFRQAIAKDPTDWELWFELYNASSGSEAREAFRRTYELNPRGVAG